MIKMFIFSDLETLIQWHVLMIQCFMICQRVSVSKYFVANVTSLHAWGFMLIPHMSSYRRAWSELFVTNITGEPRPCEIKSISV